MHRGSLAQLRPECQPWQPGSCLWTAGALSISLAIADEPKSLKGRTFSVKETMSVTKPTSVGPFVEHATLFGLSPVWASTSSAATSAVGIGCRVASLRESWGTSLGHLRIT